MKSGWQEKTNLKLNQFIEQLINSGVKCIIYTDISKDGTLAGANTEQLENLRKYKDIDFILSGGVTSVNELKSISQEYSFLYGAIVGKALYEETINLEEAIKVVK